MNSNTSNNVKSIKKIMSGASRLLSQALIEQSRPSSKFDYPPTFLVASMFDPPRLVEYNSRLEASLLKL